MRSHASGVSAYDSTAPPVKKRWAPGSPALRERPPPRAQPPPGRHAAASAPRRFPRRGRDARRPAPVPAPLRAGRRRAARRRAPPAAAGACARRGAVARRPARPRRARPHQRVHQVHPRPPRVPRLHQPRVHVDVAGPSGVRIASSDSAPCQSSSSPSRARSRGIAGCEQLSFELDPPPAPSRSRRFACQATRRPGVEDRLHHHERPGQWLLQDHRAVRRSRARRRAAPGPVLAPIARPGSPFRSAPSRTPGSDLQAATSAVTVDAGCGSPSSSSTPQLRHLVLHPQQALERRHRRGSREARGVPGQDRHLLLRGQQHVEAAAGEHREHASATPPGRARTPAPGAPGARGA